MNLSIHQLAIEEVRSRLDTLSAGRPFFARDGYSIQMDVDRPLLGDVLSLMRVPARLSENRIVLVTRGRARFTLDMETFDVQAPCFALLKDKALLRIQSVDKALLRIQSVSADFLCHVIAYRERSVLDAQQKVVVPVSDAEEKNIEALIRLIWRYCVAKPFLYTVVSPLLEALFEQYAALSERAQQKGGKVAASRKEELFRGFLALVSEHWLDERELAWYADALCISVHYLCEAVYAVGGHYPKHYIRQTIVSEAKYLRIGSQIPALLYGWQRRRHRRRAELPQPRLLQPFLQAGNRPHARRI